MTPAPTIGRIVHWTDSQDGTVFPAIVVEAFPVDSAAVREAGRPVCSVFVFTPSHSFPMTACRQAPDGAAPGSAEARGFWQWPPR